MVFIDVMEAVQWTSKGQFDAFFKRLLPHDAE